MNIISKFATSPLLMSWANMTARIGGLLLLLPLILAKHTDEEVVLWYLFASLTSLLIMLDFGLSVTTSRFMSYAFGGKNLLLFDDLSVQQCRTDQQILEVDWNSVALLRRFNLSAYTGIAVIGLIIGMSLGTLALKSPLENAGLNGFSGWSAWIFVLIASCLQLCNTRFNAELQGANKIALVNLVQMLTSVGAVLSASVTLWCDYTIVELVFAYYFWTFINILIMWVFARNYFRAERSYSPTKSQIIRFGQTIWGPVWRSGIGILLSAGLIQLSGVLYAQLASAREAASYMLCLQMIRAISLFSNVPFYTKIPRLSMNYAKGDRSEIVIAAQKAMRMTFAVYLILYIAITLSADFILALIQTQIAFPSKLVWLLFGLAILIERYGAMHIQLYSLTNNVVWHIANGVTGSLMLFFSFFLYPLFKVTAFPLSVLLSYSLFYSWYCAKHSYREFKLDFFQFEKTCFIPALASMLVFAGFYGIS